MENIRALDMEVEVYFSAVIGEKCWSVIAGAGTGSMFTLAFGHKIPRARPIRNPGLSKEQRELDGEFVVFIKNASWRIEHLDLTMCTNDDSNDAGGSMIVGLRNLVEKTILSANVTDDAGSFELKFENDFGLIVCCSDEDCENYSLHNLDRVLVR